LRVEGMRGKCWVDDWMTTHVVAVLGPFDVILLACFEFGREVFEGYCREGEGVEERG
jgi:hypothetical protein